MASLLSWTRSSSSYYKMKSDYRYLAEFALGETKSKAGEDACDACVEANKIAENDLAVTHPVRLAMDTKFLRSLKTRCSETNEKFDRRLADRQVELKTVIDAIGILNSDTSFDTYDKTVSTDFLQMSPLAGEQALRQRALSVLRDATNKVVDDPVVQVPQAHVSEKTVEIRQLDVVEKIVETPEIQTGHSIQGRIQQRTLEQIVDTSIPQVVAEATKDFSQNRVQQSSMEQTIANPAISLAEETVEMPVIRTKEKTPHVVNTHVQHVVNAVETEMPKIIRLRKKPIINEKINQVTKHVEIPQTQEQTIESVKVHPKGSNTELQRGLNCGRASSTDSLTDSSRDARMQVPTVQVAQKTVKEIRSKFEVGHTSEVHARNRSDKNRRRETEV